jgi:hypothetical protein
MTLFIHVKFLIMKGFEQTKVTKNALLDRYEPAGFLG